MNTNKPIEPPKAWKWLLESRAPFEGLSLFPSAPWLATVPRGDGQPILLAPGFAASERSLKPLYMYLKWLGYRPHHWQQGRNNGDVEAYVNKMLLHTEHLFIQHEEKPIALIGWSLGGVILREVAREKPQLVDQVITMGSPIIGGPKYTQTANFYKEQQGVNLDELEAKIHQRNLDKIECPITCIYSKTDGVVAWQAARDNYNPQARNVEVFSSHIGLGVNPRVWRIIANTLAHQSRL